MHEELNSIWDKYLLISKFLKFILLINLQSTFLPSLSIYDGQNEFGLKNASQIQCEETKSDNDFFLSLGFTDVFISLKTNVKTKRGEI